MENKLLITEKAYAKLMRNQAIIEDFEKAEGLIMPIKAAIAKKHGVSICCVHNVLRNAGLLGRGKKVCGR